jgi:hypothetical protein
MSKSAVNSASHDEAGQANGAVTWSSEFERIFILGSARIRGEKISNRRPSPRFMRGSDYRR